MPVLATSTQIEFMGKRKLAIGLSLIFVATSLFFLATRGLSFGISVSHAMC